MSRANLGNNVVHRAADRGIPGNIVVIASEGYRNSRDDLCDDSVR